MSTSLRSQLLRQLPSYYRVEPNHLLVIVQHGRKIRFAETGDVWVNPFFEERAGMLYIGFRKVDLTVEVQSADGLPIYFSVRVYFVFDPRTARPDYQQGIAMQVLTAEDALQQMVYAFLADVLRERVCNRRVLDLLSGVQTVKLCRRLEKELRAPFEELGVKLKSRNAITIYSVRGPQALHEALEWVTFKETIAKVFSMPGELLEGHLLTLKKYEQIAKSGGSINLFVQHGGEMLSQQVMRQLMGGAAHGNRKNGANHSQHRSTSSEDLVIDHESW